MPAWVLDIQPPTSDLIPADRITTFQPGVTYNATPSPGSAGNTIPSDYSQSGYGIPTGGTIFATLSPSGGDDTATIQAALNGAGAAASSSSRQIVQLNSGLFEVSGGILALFMGSSYVTLRGSGPGTGASGGDIAEWAGGARTSSLVGGGTGTFILKTDRATEATGAILQIGYDPSSFSTSINLASDAAQGSYSLTLASNPGLAIGEMVLVDQITDNHPLVFWGLAHEGPGGGTRRQFARQDRSLNQIVEISAINGNTITFTTPLHIKFETQYTAQLSRYTNPVLTGIGVEDICFMGGMGGDYHGNIAMFACRYSWVKHVESYWIVGTSIGMYGCFRCDVRDSYVHESGDPNPGGGGYLIGMAYGTSDCLVENNIMWNANKQDIVKATGGGNVIAYNYMDDAFGAGYPTQPEAGVNAGHMTTPHMELIEGNYSHNYKGDAYWGNSIYITAFRNNFSGLRAAHGNLSTYTFTLGGVTVPYMDLQGRACVDVQAHSYNTNFVGNVLGLPGQALLSYTSATFSFAQVAFVYEELGTLGDGTHFNQWRMGEQQNPDSAGGPIWVADTYTTQLRQGNWDWFTQTQIWYSGVGSTGTTSTGPAKFIPNSLYLRNKPSFFGSNAWPWVNPANGSTSTLPAKARFDAGTPNVL